jgi:hypothetical protein
MKMDGALFFVVGVALLFVIGIIFCGLFIILF